MRRAARSIALALIAASLTWTPAGAQTASQCEEAGSATPEEFGPTDINATTGNQRLSVAVNADGTVTVLKWPSPSFYDQIKYRTTDRREQFKGALPNEGSLLGLSYRVSGNDRFAWLRTWRSKQRISDDDSDVVVTTFSRRGVGLTVTVRDVVAAGRDVLARRVVVARDDGSRVTRAGVIAFANLNPVFSKNEQAPYADWCLEAASDDGAEYRAGPDAVVHARSGIDASTEAESSVALAFGLARPSDGHEVGEDTFSGADGRSAYSDAADGRLSGDDAATGAADAALLGELDLRRKRTGTVDVFIAAARTPARALRTLDRARSTGFFKLQRAKARWWRSWLDDAVLPRRAPRAVMQLAKRSLVVIRQGFDATVPDHDPEGHTLRDGGTVVSSIATQSPYGIDWVREGAFVNSALDAAGHPEMVDLHNFRYGLLQTEAGDTTRGGSPLRPGNWSEAFYADGVVAGTTPYEIDSTGFGIWTLWDHFRVTDDAAYLLSELIYEAIQRAAHDLTDICRDPATGLHCASAQDGDPTLRQGLRGAMAAWVGLDSAVRAARFRGGEAALANAMRWATRRDELRAAIDERFFDGDCGCYTTDPRDGGALLWPVRLVKGDDERVGGQADANWRTVSRALRGRSSIGGEEIEAILGNAHVWSGPAERRKLKRALEWVAKVPTTARTRLLGDAWMNFPRDSSPVVTMLSQPHLPSHAMFYLAALEVYGRAPYRF